MFSPILYSNLGSFYHIIIIFPISYHIFKYFSYLLQGGLNTLKFLFDYLKGIAIGAGAILPGISSGVLCVIFGIYEKLIDSVLNIFKDFKTNFKFLLPIGLGGVTGILLFGKILKYLFYTYPMQTKFAFIGLIIGCIPILFKKRVNVYIYLRLKIIYPLLLTLFVPICLLEFVGQQRQSHNLPAMNLFGQTALK